MASTRRGTQGTGGKMNSWMRLKIEYHRSPAQRERERKSFSTKWEKIWLTNPKIQLARLKTVIVFAIILVLDAVSNALHDSPRLSAHRSVGR